MNISLLNGEIDFYFVIAALETNVRMKASPGAVRGKGKEGKS